MPRLAALLASIAALLPAGTRAYRTPATSDGSAPAWRALFAGVSPGRVDLWSVRVDGGDRRPLLSYPAFGDRYSIWSSRIDAHTPAVRSAVSGDGRWVALLLDASPGRQASLWLANVETRALPWPPRTSRASSGRTKGPRSSTRSSRLPRLRWRSSRPSRMAATGACTTPTTRRIGR